MRLVGVKVDKDKKGYFNSDGFELSRPCGGRGE